MSYVELLQGDCRDVLALCLPDNSVDAIVTDPPYELGFMGKHWDASGIAYSVPLWTECLRVLKPGGHLLAFSGSRTYHRMTCAIEDAGFEVRDQIMYVYGSGFPKSMNLDREKGKKFCGCDHEKAKSDAGGKKAPAILAAGEKQETEHDLRKVREGDIPTPVDASTECKDVLQPFMRESGIRERATSYERGDCKAGDDRPGQSSMEGRCNAAAQAGELCAGPLCESAGGCSNDGEAGRVCHGTPVGNGEVDRANADAGGSRSSRRSQSAKQRSGKPGAMAGQPESQTLGAWPICSGCGLPRIPSGLGTSLKPAHEPICVARKPLIGTVAENVLRFGTGAINVDGCRVGDEVVGWGGGAAGGNTWNEENCGLAKGGDARPVSGRWPANLIHDGSEEVVALFPQSNGAGGSVPNVKITGYGDGIGTGKSEYFGGERTKVDSGSGSAARFFYCAKASKKDRGEGNGHPTVKPTDLMRYLCRLVTPPGGTVLDPFMGSGSTGKAAVLEGFQFIGCELSEEYMAIAKARIAAAEVTTSESCDKV